MDERTRRWIYARQRGYTGVEIIPPSMTPRQERRLTKKRRRAFRRTR